MKRGLERVRCAIYAVGECEILRVNVMPQLNPNDEASHGKHWLKGIVPEPPLCKQITPDTCDSFIQQLGQAVAEREGGEKQGAPHEHTRLKLCFREKMSSGWVEGFAQIGAIDWQRSSCHGG